MKFTVLGHACLFVETPRVSILIDPWVIGSCYWRSWWNFPEPDADLIRAIKPDFIYITHLHWDHFHGPSLRLFDRDTQIVVPRTPTMRMVKDLHSLQFTNVREMPHASSLELTPGLELFSYQFGAAFTDSAVVITDGRTTLLDANDCKLFGWSLKNILARFPTIDFAFRSHSSANPFPYCIEDYETKFPTFRTKQDYIEEFAHFGLSIGAHHTIPFASNHCFLHRETIRFNDTAVLPPLVCDRYNQLAIEHGSSSRCQVMPPGSSWSDQDGFSIVPFDYTGQKRYVERLLSRYEEKLEKQYQKEERVRGDFEGFSEYFHKLFGSVPSLLRRRLLPKMIFAVKEGSRERYWVIDGPGGEVREAESIEPCEFIIEVPALVINDCCHKRMFSAWTPSKRLKIRLKGNGMGAARLFLSLLDLYENDGLPIHKNFTSRQIGIRIRRWRELVDFIVLIYTAKTRGKNFSVADLYPIK